MVIVDSTASPVIEKRRGKGAAHRKKCRNLKRSRSSKLVKSGRVHLTPCVVCGSTENLSIHHIEPLQPDRFVFLCEECHTLAHKPVFRTMEVCIASSHFSVRPEAIVQVTHSPTHTSAPVDDSANGEQAPAAGTNSPCRKGVDRG